MAKLGRSAIYCRKWFFPPPGCLQPPYKSREELEDEREESQNSMEMKEGVNLNMHTDEGGLLQRRAAAGAASTAD